jgi:hypothetical protein
MGDDRGRVSGWLVSAAMVAFLLVLAGAGAVVWAQRDQDDAHRQEQRLRTELALQRDARSPDRFAATHTAIQSVRTQLDAIPAEAKQVTDLQGQDVLLVQAALAAGKKGDVPAYNEAVTKRNDLAPQVDAAIEKLRTDTNTVLLALAKVTNRTAP